MYFGLHILFNFAYRFLTVLHHYQTLLILQEHHILLRHQRIQGLLKPHFWMYTFIHLDLVLLLEMNR